VSGVDRSQRAILATQRPHAGTPPACAIHSAAVKHAADAAGFRWSVRVYFEDTDAAGIVYYANYLKYFERCRSEWLRALGIDQRKLAERDRRGFVVADLSVRYHRPARLDDVLVIDAAILQRARSYLVFKQKACLGDELLAEASVKVACVDSQTLAPARLPARLTDRLAVLPASLTS
jgi:acyl-CoA thioester hydrolase